MHNWTQRIAVSGHTRINKPKTVVIGNWDTFLKLFSIISIIYVIYLGLKGWLQLAIFRHRIKCWQCFFASKLCFFHFIHSKIAEHIIQQYFSHLFTCKHSLLGAAQYNISPLLFCSWQTWCFSITVTLKEEKRLVTLSFTHFPLPTLSIWGVTSSMWPCGQHLSSLTIRLPPLQFVILMLTPYCSVDESAIANTFRAHWMSV